MKKIILLSAVFVLGAGLSLLWRFGGLAALVPYALIPDSLFKTEEAGQAARRPGDVVDVINGVSVYFNGPVPSVHGRNLAPDGYNIGQKYQCVEFVKRYYYEALQHKMPDAYGHAKDFFDSSLADGAMNAKRGLRQYANGGQAKPQIGDLLIFGPTAFNSYGHVAIVSAVGESEVEYIQQNPGPDQPSRVRMGLSARENGDGETLWSMDSGRVMGWLRKEP